MERRFHHGALAGIHGRKREGREVYAQFRVTRSAVVGNFTAALVGVAVCLPVPDKARRIALTAVGLAIIVATTPCCAVLPPAGAVAVTAAMSPDANADLGYLFALAPVALQTELLILIAIGWSWSSKCMALLVTDRNFRKRKGYLWRPSDTSIAKIHLRLFQHLGRACATSAQFFAQRPRRPARKGLRRYERHLSGEFT